MFDPTKFLEIAKKLVDDPNYKDECGYRTSIGRSYYAAFLVVKKKLEERDVSFKDVDRLHKDVIDEVMYRRNKFLGSQLETLREERVCADYYVREIITETKARNCTKLSEIIVNSVNLLDM